MVTTEEPPGGHVAKCVVKDVMMRLAPIALTRCEEKVPHTAESVLEEELRAPEEWRRELSRERSRLRAYYIKSSQEVAESLVQLIVRLNLLPHRSTPDRFSCSCACAWL